MASADRTGSNHRGSPVSPRCPPGAVPSLSDLATRGRRRRFPAGTTLFAEGGRSTWIGFLEQGRIRVSVLTEDGREIILAVREPGEVLGDLMAIDGQPHSASVVALERVEVLAVSLEDFTGFLTEHPEAREALVRQQSRRLREGAQRYLEVTTTTAPERVARHLVELAERFGEPQGAGVRIAMPMSQEDLARWVGCSREAVSKALRVLRDRGLLRTSRRSVIILDMAALKSRVS